MRVVIATFVLLFIRLCFSLLLVFSIFFFFDESKGRRSEFYRLVSRLIS